MSAAPPPVAFTTPGYWRRLAAFVYEGVLLFGVVMTVGLLYAGLTQQRHALQGTTGLQIFLFVVLGAYFVWFWTHGGQTVATKTWRIRVVTIDGRALGPARALARFVLSWLWFLPSLLVVQLAGLKGMFPISAALLGGVLGYAALALTNPRRQYWHDLACGTMLVDWPGAARGGLPQ